MLCQFATLASEYGLKINFGKTKIMTRDYCSAGCTSIPVGPMCVSVLSQEASEKYLGRKLAFDGNHQVELKNRFATAWGAFHKHKGELCSKHYRLQDRARLFDAVVSPTLLYGCCAWALTKSMERTLRTQRRKMLRYVFRIHRLRDESWIEYMKRSAGTVDDFAVAHSMRDWVVEYRRLKWRAAGEFARKTDGRWSKRTRSWKPTCGVGRKQGRPKTRWSDDLEKFVGSAWNEVACDRYLWNILEEGFVAQL